MDPRNNVDHGPARTLAWMVMLLVLAIFGLTLHVEHGRPSVGAVEAQFAQPHPDYARVLSASMLDG